MIDVEVLRQLILEDDYPMLQDETLEAICMTYTDINQAAYICCKMKAKSDKIKIGPIEIASNRQMWVDLANVFYGLWQQGPSSTNGSKGLSGKCVGRVDEF